jgi:hypothetical protein
MADEIMNLVGKDKETTGNKGKVKLTKGQEEAVCGLVEFINMPYDKSRSVYGLTGPGGVGKTFVTRQIVSKCKLQVSTIKCTSPTHKACRVFSNAVGLNVDTIQSTFGFRLNLNLENFDYKDPAFQPISSPKLDNIQLLICDEASMLNASLVTYIITKCQDLNIKVLFIGDEAQLSPVNETRSSAFYKCNKVFRLTEIVRQGEGNPILMLLDLLRYDIANCKRGSRKFIDYINTHQGTTQYNSIGEGFAIMGSQKFTSIIKERFNDEEYTRNIELYKLIAYTNICVTQWNSFIRNNIIADCERSIITKNDLIMSYETIVDEFNDIIINNSEEYIIKDIVNYTNSTYGFKGFLIKFQMVNSGKITKPLFVIDHTDKFTVIQYIKVLNQLISDAQKATGGTRAARWKEYYDFKKQFLIATNIKHNDQIKYKRDLDYAFAITAHKSQGSTYDNVFVDVNDMIFTSTGATYANYEETLRRLYVACSRARKELVLSFGR